MNRTQLINAYVKLAYAKAYRPFATAVLINDAARLYHKQIVDATHVELSVSPAIVKAYLRVKRGPFSTFKEHYRGLVPYLEGVIYGVPVRVFWHKKAYRVTHHDDMRIFCQTTRSLALAEAVEARRRAAL